MKRTATAAVLLAALATLTACSSSDSSDDAKPTPSATSAAPAIDSGMPAKPTGQARTDLLAKLRAVNAALVADEDKAISNARNQCSSINGKSPKVDWAAQQRFSSSAHEVSDAEAKAINAALAGFCATA